MNITRKKTFIVTVVKNGCQRRRKVIFICERKNSSITYKKDKIFSIRKDPMKIRFKNGPEEFDEIIKFPNCNCTLLNNKKFNKIEFNKETFNNLNKNGRENFNDFDFDEIANIEINKKSKVIIDINCSECKYDKTDFQ